MPNIANPLSRFRQAVTEPAKENLRRMAQPKDDNVWKARIMGGLSGAGEGLIDLLTPGDHDVMPDLSMGLAPVATAIGNKSLPTIAKEAYGAVKGLKGLYSRLTNAATKLPEVVPVAKLEGLLRSAGAPKEEMGYRNLGDFLSNQTTPDVPRQAVLDHLEANPIRLETSNRRYDPEFQTRTDMRTQLSDQFDDRYGQDQWTTTRPDAFMQEPIPGLATIDDAEYAAWRAADELPFNHPTNYQHYQTPGADPKSYREDLLFKGRNPELKAIEARMTELEDAYPGGAHIDPEYNALSKRQHEIQEADNFWQPGQHFYGGDEDAPERMIAWTRSNERDIPQMGGRGRFIETDQSDIHQFGQDFGYSFDDMAKNKAKAEGWLENLERQHMDEGYEPTAADIAKIGEMNGRINILEDYRGPELTHVPFRDSWEELPIKQHLLEAAEDPNANWVGWLGGQGQADRWKSGKASGLMHAYDEKLPNRVNKILKPFGAQVEKFDIPWPEDPYPAIGLSKGTVHMNVPGTEQPVDVASQFPRWDPLEYARQGTNQYDRGQELYQTIANQVDRGIMPPQSYGWGVRLTPEQKAMMKKVGFPAMAALFGLNSMGQPNQEQQ